MISLEMVRFSFYYLDMLDLFISDQPKPNSERMVMANENAGQTTLSAQNVGREFVRQYYTFMNAEPHHLHRCLFLLSSVK